VVIVLVAVAAVIVFAIAATVIGREARRLDSVPPEPVFNVDEAVEWVADHLPFEITAVLSHDDVRRIIDWNIEFFRSKAASGNGKGGGHTSEAIVVGGPETVDYVLARSSAAGGEYTAEQVHAVLTAQMAYLDAIGAVGPEAPPSP
jgi:hypothetical protein